ncbi:hypothetical protein LTS18_002414 [Coniosporium uncinatum]|uniref:Uncharacterized protein n=1 Tax=Coniosporium uncinatum TaxID=93489 RepID=A0ACC3DUI4_9PEZI|nr:hypothetical protein LTS18_002414 [Coniosporium uncinatum]
MKSFILALATLHAVAALPQVSKCQNSAAQMNAAPLPPEVFIQQKLSATPTTPGAKMSKIRYGPFSMKPMQMIENEPYFTNQMPCQNCFITAMEANLEDDAGKTININEGAWLHHMVLYLRGLDRRDLICGRLTAAGIGGQRIFASGNERNPVRLNTKGDYGLKVDNDDKITLLYDLVNNLETPQNFWMYEYVPMSSPEAASYTEAQLAWLDITDCGDSEAPPQRGVYSVKSSPDLWVPKQDYKLLTAFGHVHDGGQMVQAIAGNKSVCDSAQLYGRSESFIEPMSGPGAMNPGMQHVSDVGSCVDIGVVKAGTPMSVVAKYDTNKNPLNKEMDGHDQTIMGISFVYVAPVDGATSGAEVVPAT